VSTAVRVRAWIMWDISLSRNYYSCISVSFVVVVVVVVVVLVVVVVVASSRLSTAVYVDTHGSRQTFPCPEATTAAEEHRTFHTHVIYHTAHSSQHK